MKEKVEVFKPNIGFVTAFSIGDTVRLDKDSLWTKNLNFIFGTGSVGSYVQNKIDHKSIAFRKKNPLDYELHFYPTHQ